MICEQVQLDPEQYPGEEGLIHWEVSRHEAAHRQHFEIRCGPEQHSRHWLGRLPQQLICQAGASQQNPRSCWGLWD